ncbi:hypothetical protein FXO37_22401 [Capsicum annuum]|nr:hypothetical protein FXO37_22401 [Capsicum annuum]
MRASTSSKVDNPPPNDQNSGNSPRNRAIGQEDAGYSTKESAPSSSRQDETAPEISQDYMVPGVSNHSSVVTRYMQKAILHPKSFRADIVSISLLQDSFHKFSCATGLKANLEKSSIYMEGVIGNLKFDILQSLGYMEGSLPFKYLGVPHSTKKLTIPQCVPLVEKFAARINCWSAKLLSYASRLQLIKGSIYHTWGSLVQGNKFKIKRAYKAIQPQLPRMAWKSVILHKMVHPRFKFHLWIIVQKRLATVDRLQKIGVQVPMSCIFFDQEVETFDHLFFICLYNKKLWTKLIAWIGANRCVEQKQHHIQEYHEKSELVFPQPAAVRLIPSSVNALSGRKLATEFAPFARGGDQTPDLLLKGHGAEPPCQL